MQKRCFTGSIHRGISWISFPNGGRVDLWSCRGSRDVHDSVRLLDLATGAIKEETSFLNPQIRVGPDILTRIHYAGQEGGLQELQALLVKSLNQEIRFLAEIRGISTRRIVGASVAGNTTMTHLFLGLDTYWICREPYIPVLNRPGLVRASELGLGIHERGVVFVFPNAGSYFGGT